MSSNSSSSGNSGSSSSSSSSGSSRGRRRTTRGGRSFSEANRSGTSPYSRSNDINRYRQHGYGYDPREAGGRGNVPGGRQGNPPPPPPNNDDNDAEERRRQAEIAEQQRLARVADAVASRDAAMATMKKSITDAFGSEFGDDYYTGLSTSFTDMYGGDLTSAYQAALRGIYEGFRNAGVFDQASFDTQSTALDKRKAEEQARLAQLAKGYADTQKTAVTGKQTSILGDLAKLSGTAGTVAEANRQRQAIQDFDFQSQIDAINDTPEMTKPSAFLPKYYKPSMVELQGETQLGGTTPETSASRTATGGSRSIGRSPVGSGSSSVIRG